MSDAKTRRSAFLKNDQEDKVVEFEGDVPNAIVRDCSVKEAKEALGMCKPDFNAAEFNVAKLIICTLDAETKEPYFEKANFDALCEARGDAKRRLGKLFEAMEESELGN